MVTVQVQDQHSGMSRITGAEKEFSEFSDPETKGAGSVLFSDFWTPPSELCKNKFSVSTDEPLPKSSDDRY